MSLSFYMCIDLLYVVMYSSRVYSLEYLYDMCALQLSNIETCTFVLAAYKDTTLLGTF